MTVRLVLCAYLCLGLVLAADRRAWLALPLCMIALLVTGELWLRASAGLPVERGLPVARLGFGAVAGLATLPLVALGLHAAGAPIRPLPLVTGGAVVVTVLGGIALVRKGLAGRRLPAQRTGGTTSPASAPARIGGTAPRSFAPAHLALAVMVPGVLVLAIGGLAVRAHLASPRPAEPGYLSVALGGWAARIERPVTVPARGLTVPVRVVSSGLGPTTTLVRVSVGGLLTASRPVTIAADTESSVSVRVPAPPPDGCLRAVTISIGATSTGFYATRPAGSATRAAGSAAGSVPRGTGKGRVPC